MTKIPASPYWSANPTIEIYLDPSSDRQEPMLPPETEEHICPTCNISSRDAPIHCLSVSPSSLSSSPPSTSPPAYNTLSLLPPRHLTVPTLHIQTPTLDQRLRPQAPLPSLQIDPEGRPNVRFRKTAFSPLSPPSGRINAFEYDRTKSLGLGLVDVPVHAEVSPVTPGSIETEEENNKSKESRGAPSNLAQRIEQRLWRYSASRNVVKRWLLEIISWLLSAACMAGIIIMLWVYHNRKMPTWPMGVTLNAYISVLAKIASAGLLLPVSEAIGQLKWSWFNKKDSKKMWDFELFDNASRGPWGSFLLLLRTKGRSLVALGAAVTVLALALDPFFQQVVQYPEPWRLSPGYGTVPRAIGYQPDNEGMQYRQLKGQEYQVDSTLLGVTNRYLFDNGIASMSFGKGKKAEVPVSCPSSKCTWPRYETLAVCSKCTDIYETLEFKCLNATLDWVQKPDLNDTTMEVIYPTGVSCGWWLNTDSPILMTGYNVDINGNYTGETLLTRGQPLYDILSRAPLPGYSAKLNDTRNPLAHVLIASGGNLDAIHRNDTPIAHECLVSWCVHEILSEYSDGIYTETINNTYFNKTQDFMPWVTFDLFDDSGKRTGTEYFYMENMTINTPGGGTYMVDNTTQTLTLFAFDEAFPSTYSVVAGEDEGDGLIRYKQYITIDPWTQNMTYNAFLYPNITTHMDNMAQSMTNLVRSTVVKTIPVSGPAYDKESIVSVRWAWLILPLGLLVLTFLFLVATIIRNSIEQDNIGVYKNSAIATLLFGLPDEMQNKIKGAKDTGTPRANAKGVRVKWVSRAGWRFSGNTFSPGSIRSNGSPIVDWGRKRDT